MTLPVSLYGLLKSSILSTSWSYKDLFCISFFGCWRVLFFFSRSCPFIYESTWFCATVDDPFPITKYQSTHSEKIRRTKCYVKKCSFRPCRKKIFKSHLHLSRPAFSAPRSLDAFNRCRAALVAYVCRRVFNDWRKWIFKVIHGPHGQRSLRTDSVSAFGGVNRYRQ